MCVCVSQTDGKHSGETTTRPSPFRSGVTHTALALIGIRNFNHYFLSSLCSLTVSVDRRKEFFRQHSFLTPSPCPCQRVDANCAVCDLTGCRLSFISVFVLWLLVTPLPSRIPLDLFFFHSLSRVPMKASPSLATHTEEHLCQAVIERAEPGLLQSINRTGGETRVETLICDIPPLGAAVIV